MSSAIVLRIVVLTASLLAPALAPAATEAGLCEAAKLSAASKFPACRLKADSVFAKSKAEQADLDKRQTAYDKCDAALAKAYAAAETKYGAACPTAGEVADVRDFLMQCSNDVGAANEPGGSVPDYIAELAACDTDLDSASAALVTCETDEASCQAGLSGCSASLVSTEANLTAATADLSTCTSDLGACNGSLSTCDSDKASCQTSLSTCDTSLGTCNTDLSSAQSNLGTCSGSLSTCDSDRASCQSSLGTCSTSLSSTQSSLDTCTGSLGTCNGSLGTCQSDLSTYTSMATGGSVTGGNGQRVITIPDGIYTGSRTATAIDANLIAANIRSGTSIFGVSGTVAAASQFCGNNLSEGSEICDGTDRNGKTCATQTPSTPFGTVTCDAGCTAYVTSACVAGYEPQTVLGNATVVDHYNGLEWVVTDDAGGITDKDNTYTWTVANPWGDSDGTVFTSYIAGLNAMNSGAGYAGHNDWRLPTVQIGYNGIPATGRRELETTYNTGFSNPGINQSVFGPTANGIHWSSTSKGYYAWFVDYSNGVRQDYAPKGNAHYARAVRTQP